MSKHTSWQKFHTCNTIQHIFIHQILSDQLSPNILCNKSTNMYILTNCSLSLFSPLSLSEKVFCISNVHRIFCRQVLLDLPAIIWLFTINVTKLFWEHTDGICYRARDGMVMKDSVWGPGWGTSPRVCRGTAFWGWFRPEGGTQWTTGSATWGCLVGRHNLCMVEGSNLKCWTFTMNIIKF